MTPTRQNPAADKQTTIEIPAIELFDANELFAVSNEIITPQEKNRSASKDVSDYDAFDFNEVLNTRFEEILPEKNICADFVLDSEFKFNATLADSSSCRKQELIDFERKIQGSEMNRQ